MRPALQRVDRLGVYSAAGHAPNTLRRYDADWAHFAAWCPRQGERPLPADPRVVALYLVDLADSQPDADPPESPRAVGTSPGGWPASATFTARLATQPQ